MGKTRMGRMTDCNVRPQYSVTDNVKTMNTRKNELNISVTWAQESRLFKVGYVETKIPQPRVIQNYRRNTGLAVGRTVLLSTCE